MTKMERAGESWRRSLRQACQSDEALGEIEIAWSSARGQANADLSQDRCLSLRTRMEAYRVPFSDLERKRAVFRQISYYLDASELIMNRTRYSMKAHECRRGRQSDQNQARPPPARQTPESWATSYGTYLTGQGAIDGADAVAIAMEARWGAGRLRLLVDDKLREKFDRQRFLFNAAIWHGDLQAVVLQSRRMIAAWQTLAREAEAAGAPLARPLRSGRWRWWMAPWWRWYAVLRTPTPSSPMAGG